MSSKHGSNRVGVEGGEAEEAEDKNVCGCTESTQAKLAGFYDSTPVSLYTGVVTIYSLIGEDLLFLTHRGGYMMGTQQVDCDWIHKIMCLYMFIVFLSEWICFVFCKKSYPWSFFFYLDFVATASLILDFGPLFTPVQSTDTSDMGSMARAGRAARIGTRAGRLVRLLRLFRLFKLFKLAKKAGGDEEVELNAEVEDVEPSAVGTVLGELTTQKVVIGVMLMLLVIPFLEASDPDQSIAMGLTLAMSVPLGARRDAEIDALIRDYPTICLLNLSIPGTTERDVRFYDSVNFPKQGCKTQKEKKDAGDETALQCPQWLLGDNTVAKPYTNGFYRFNSELTIFASNTESLTAEEKAANKYDYTSIALVDTYQGLAGYQCPGEENPPPCKNGQPVALLDSGGSYSSSCLNMLKTLFITFLLGLGSAMFSRDATRIAVGPIERMVNVVKKLSDNPLGDLNDPSERKQQEVPVVPVDDGKPAGMCGKKKPKKPVAEDPNADETKMLANSIKNIGGLLQKGFGAAGAKIITANLKTANEELDVVRPGSNIEAIYGFCDIRQFTDTTECILAQIMGFVNMSADVVHGITVEHFGAPNKNVGDAFLLVWRFDEGTKEEPGELQGPEWRSRTECADGALMAYHEMVCHLKKHKALNTINQHQALEKRFNPDGKHPYMIRLGCGLHVGYSVEGAIGTEQKVDCSYLGLPVKVPERLQDGMKIYKNWILMSKDFWVLLSKEKQDMTRILDIVDIDGNFKEERHPEVEDPADKRAFNMYTHDVIPELCDESNHPFYSKVPIEEHSGLRPFGERNAGPNCTMPKPTNTHGKDGKWKNTDYKNPAAYERLKDQHQAFCRKYETALSYFLGRNDMSLQSDDLPNGKPDQNAPYDESKCDWAKAKALFEELADHSDSTSGWLWKEEGWMTDGWESNGPSKVMLDYMAENNYQKPAGWNGIHSDFEI